MKNEAAGKARARKTAVGIGTRTLLAALLLAAAFYMVGAISNYGLDLTFLYYPIAFATLALYGLSVLVVLKSQVAKILTLEIRALLITAVFIAYLTVTDVSFSPVGYLLSAAVTVFVAYRIAIFHSRTFGALILCAFFVVLGLLAENLINEFYGLPQLGTVVFYCFLVPSALSLLSLLGTANNHYISYMGRLLSNAKLLVIIGALTIFTAVYLLYASSLVTAQLLTYLIIVEWVTICLISYSVYKHAVQYISSRSQDLVLGDWTMLVQKVGVRKDKLDRVSGMVSAFVDSGNKRPLLDFISGAMSYGDVDSGKRLCVLKCLTDYRDLGEHSLFSRWRAGEIANKNRRNRIKAVRGVFKAINEIDKEKNCGS